MTSRHRHLAERIREEREIRQMLSPRTPKKLRKGIGRLLRERPRRVVVRTKLLLLMLRERQASVIRRTSCQ